MILIDNRLQVAKLRLAYIVSFTMSSIFFAFSFVSNNSFISNNVSLFIAICLMLIFVYLIRIKPEYLYVQIRKNNTILVRTYSAFPLFRKYKSFEIPINAIVEIERKKNPFYPKPFIRIVVKTKKSVGTYPWLNLAAVPKVSYNKLATYFNNTLNIAKKVEPI